MTGISNDLAEKLNQEAEEYYVAHKENDRDKINSACRSIGLDTKGFDALGSGSGRNVFDMGILGYEDLALKLAVPNKNYDGLQQNSREYEVWNKADRQQQDFLAEIVDHGTNNYWLIMRKGNSVDSVPYDWKKEAIYVLRDLVWDSDIRDENIVEINGFHKLCDYGTPPQ